VRARTRIDHREVATACVVQRRTLHSAYARAREAFGSLSARLDEETG
jgi:hypothetical protein